jgi:hypothetical protein
VRPIHYATRASRMRSRSVLNTHFWIFSSYWSFDVRYSRVIGNLDWQRKSTCKSWGFRRRRDGQCNHCRERAYSKSRTTSERYVQCTRHCHDEIHKLHKTSMLLCRNVIVFFSESLFAYVDEWLMAMTGVTINSPHRRPIPITSALVLLLSWGDASESFCRV